VTRPVAPARPVYAGYVLFVLVLGNCLNSMDRSIITILVEPIRHDLGLNDTQMGLITGLGYALIYTLCTLRMARWVDHRNRKRLLGFGIAVWSVMTALTGWVSGFASLLLARLAVGAAEATCYPTSLSLIGDYFERVKRPRAIALFQLGTYGGIIFGAITTGLLAARHGWRGAFGILGLPGVALAVLILLTVREPPRGLSEPTSPIADPTEPEGLRAMTGLLRDPCFTMLVIAALLMAVGQIILGTWVPAFLMRVHGVSQARVGLVSGPVFGLGGVAGTLVGGFAGTWIARRNRQDRAPLLVMLVTTPFAIPALLVLLFAASLPVALAGGAITAFLISLHFGPLVAVTLNRARVQNRGTAASVLVVAQYLFGFGLGPLAVGALSDLLQPQFGQQALRFAMLVSPLAVLVAAIFSTIAYRRIGPAASGGPATEIPV
jgi:predicted MFS family arabinose efflux permease